MTIASFADLPDLPARDVLPNICQALKNGPSVILGAPPGAGKTTLVPLALLRQDWLGKGKIILVEPRRLAARAAARRMASLLNEEVGQTVGYRMRLDTKISAQTRIEVMTEGVFTRIAIDQPDLAETAVIIFDEFHERALEADLGLALALDIQGALREDLKLIVMSATLDTERLHQLMGNAQEIESDGRAHPVEIRYRPRPAGGRLEAAVEEAIRSAVSSFDGSILVFLPGQAEIRRCQDRLSDLQRRDLIIAPLYGGLDAREQDLAISPVQTGSRKIVLATSIAESSLTIDGVRVVIDCGLQRKPVHEPATGIMRLETVRASRASVDQRAGRAGRTEPGIAIRLWSEQQTRALPAHSPAEILDTDLGNFRLALASWGVTDPQQLCLLDQPPKPAFHEADRLVKSLGALTDGGQLTDLGRAMQRLTLPPRLAAMVVGSAAKNSQQSAALLAVLLTEQGLGGNAIDLDHRVSLLAMEKGRRANQARELANRIARRVTSPQKAETTTYSSGELLYMAFPERLAMQRGERGAYLMANGRGARVDAEDPLAKARFLIVADLTGAAQNQRILSAVRLADETAETLFSEETVSEIIYKFDRDTRSVRARAERRFHAIVLDQKPCPLNDASKVSQALSDGVRDLGIAALPWSKSALLLRARLHFVRRVHGEDWPDVRDGSLLDKLDDWFIPFQEGVSRISDITAHSLADGIKSLVPYELQRQLDQLAPPHFTAPSGNSFAIDYSGEEPKVSIRVQELFGLDQHPTIADGRLPLVVELLSPAQRPIQITRDLPGFWKGSWRDVRAEMRGRYLKHPWPEHPQTASPTTRTKRRGS